jgi:hypothetical protein
MVAEYDQIMLESFTKLYGGRVKLRRLEGLLMGKLLLYQGALEEDIFVITFFALLAQQELGDNDPVTKRARKLLARAAQEKIHELKDEKEGIPDLKFGCNVFRRDISEHEKDFIPG